MASLRWGYLYPGFVRSATPVALEAIPQALWFFLPAFVANPMAVVFGGGSPIDGGRSLSDGQRMFGDGKTWRGLIGGTFSGAILGLLLSLPFALLASSSSCPTVRRQWRSSPPRPSLWAPSSATWLARS